MAVSTPAENIWEGFGRGVHQIRTLEEYYYYHSETPILCAGDFHPEDLEKNHSRHEVFDISFLKKDLQQALIVQDREKVERVFSEVAEPFFGIPAGKSTGH